MRLVLDWELWGWGWLSCFDDGNDLGGVGRVSVTKLDSIDHARKCSGWSEHGMLQRMGNWKVYECIDDEIDNMPPKASQNRILLTIRGVRLSMIVNGLIFHHGAVVSSILK